MNKLNKKVVIIDDDNTNNFVTKMILKSMCLPALPEIIDFTLPVEGVGYLTRILTDGGNEQIVLFLDVNMPILMGWDVLDQLNLLPDSAKERLTVFMLSSSIDPADKEKATKYPLVERFITKPITTNLLWIKEFLMNEVANEIS